MAYNVIGGLPTQQLPFSRKNKTWRKACIDFADNHSLRHNHVTRKSVWAMKVNYDLLAGKIHMSELKALINPYHIKASFIPDHIQHYPVINSKLEILEGEEYSRLFDFRVVVTNPNAISEVEDEKNQIVNARLQQLIADNSFSEEQFEQELQKHSDYFLYEYQDKREVRASRLLNHYIKELDIPIKFNQGFKDGYAVGEELYQCGISGGEPTFEKLNPREVRIIKSGTSNNIEDADMIIIEQYWNLGMIIETFWDQLSKRDIDHLEEFSRGENHAYADSMGNIDATLGNPLRPVPQFSLHSGTRDIAETLFQEDDIHTGTPFDTNGNIRVLKVYWKSRRKIKKVKSYDPETGEEEFNFYPETYHCDPDKGETEEVFWVNEAWEGIKLGDDIYINMHPMPVQYSRLSNPSKCHFGIIGSIYSSNGEEPYSLVDIMKNYAYLYDVYHDRLNKLLAKNVGKVIRLDFAKVPKGWNTDQWLYYLNINGIAVEDSYKEGEYGRSTGVLAGQMNNASSGVVDASLGSEILQYINLLDWCVTKIGELAGISRQREGQISNRETVGGVERATLQSSYSTEWLFIIHESVKKRCLECLLETAKICLRGRKKKFEYLLSDGSRQMMEIDGDEFAECDYGLVVDNSRGSQLLNQKLDTLAQAALQNQTLDFSTIMKIYTTESLAEKQRIVENNERRIKEQRMQEQQQNLQLQQQQLQQQQQLAQLQLQQQIQMHREDNETKLLVAQINAEAEHLRMEIINHEDGLTKEQELSLKKQELDEKAKEFKARLDLDRQKHKDNLSLKEKQLAYNKSKSNK